MMNGGPDLLFGIDVGMSCTGVSYLNRTRGNTVVQTFKDWGPFRLEDKAPTRLKYTEPGGKPSSWGFECDNGQQGVIREWFKTDFGEGEHSGANQAEVRRWYKDYLECLYKQLRGEFPQFVLNGKVWAQSVIHFIFSVPATWDTRLVEEFCVLARQAGFGSQDTFLVKATLTEPHAVAAYTLSSEGIIKNGQTMLIIDAGGGTVDLCFLVVEDAKRGKVSMSEVSPVQGIQCGSTFIDSAFMDLATDRLLRLEHMIEGSVEDAAWHMMRSSDFQSNKKKLGSDECEVQDMFQIKVPGLDACITDASLRVRNGEMQFTWSELKNIFNIQVTQITRLLDGMMDQRSLKATTRFSRVDHVVLSGGLGSSKYIQQEIFNHITKSKLASLHGAQLHKSTEPQMSVCRGLLEHAIQSLESSTMFRSHLSRTSLGIPCRKRCKAMATGSQRNLQKRAEEEGRVAKDQTGQRWIEGYMDWFVKWGDEINDSKSLRYPFSMEFGLDVKPEYWRARVPIMTSLRNPYPMFNKRDEVRLHTTLEADLSQASRESIVKRNTIWGLSSKKAVVSVRFLIEAAVGVADVRFRCLDAQTMRPISGDAALEFEIEEQAEPLPTSSLVREDKD